MGAGCLYDTRQPAHGGWKEGLLLRGRGRIRVNQNFHAAVLGAAGFCIVVGNRLTRALTQHGHALCGHTVLRQEAGNRVGTVVRQRIVDGIVARAVGVADHGDGGFVIFRQRFRGGGQRVLRPCGRASERRRCRRLSHRRCRTMRFCWVVVDLARWSRSRLMPKPKR